MHGAPACLSTLHSVHPAEQVLEAALDLLQLLAAADGEALSGCCRLGFIPAVLRFALPSTPIDLRLQVCPALGVAGRGGLCCKLCMMCRQNKGQRACAQKPGT